MIVVEAQAIADAYSDRFDNLDVVSHPSIMVDPRFIELLQDAVKTGRELTREKVTEVFGEEPWED